MQEVRDFHCQFGGFASAGKAFGQTSGYQSARYRSHKRTSPPLLPLAREEVFRQNLSTCPHSCRSIHGQRELPALEVEEPTGLSTLGILAHEPKPNGVMSVFSPSPWHRKS